MDMHAYGWALKLLGEVEGNAIEAMVGLKLKALADTTVAITGADLGAAVDGSPIETWRSFLLQRGQVLSFSKRKDGVRAYIAVKGGFLVPKVRGSVSTTLREGAGKVLQKGDRLVFTPRVTYQFHRLRTPLIPQYDRSITTLKLFISCQYDDFSEAAKETFFGSTYEVSLQSDGMGYRLQGDPVEGTGREILSEAIAYGSVQIPADGQPIVLLSQRQTIGGYPKIGVVAQEDCWRLTQLIPGAKVRFEPVTFAACGNDTNTLL
jgi:biotin-dependent carboxylase-like uncharacterized protein